MSQKGPQSRGEAHRILEECFAAWGAGGYAPADPVCGLNTRSSRGVQAVPLAGHGAFLPRGARRWRRSAPPGTDTGGSQSQNRPVCFRAPSSRHRHPVPVGTVHTVPQLNGGKILFIQPKETILFYLVSAPRCLSFGSAGGRGATSPVRGRGPGPGPG